MLIPNHAICLPTATLFLNGKITSVHFMHITFSFAKWNNASIVIVMAITSRSERG